MKYDIEVWLEYIKSVERLKLDRHMERPSVKHVKSSKTKEHDCDLVLSRIEERKSSNLAVSVLNRRERRRFRAEATVDLHGQTREISEILERFCLKCLASNVKNVVIVTGKGEGILKEAARSWLNSNPYIVFGFFEIKDSQGQSGAFGVRLRPKWSNDLR